MLRDTELLAALEHLDVHFVASNLNGQLDTAAPPEFVLRGLIESTEARMRLVLIPLFLQHPHYAKYMSGVLRRLAPLQQKKLYCYYMAAQLLQQKYSVELVELFGTSSLLPALFDQALKLAPVGLPDERLHQLAKRHAEISNKDINWYGTYEHAYQRLVRHRKKRILWQL